MSDHNYISKIAGSLKGKLSPLLQLSRAPIPSSIDMDSNSDNSQWVIGDFYLVRAEDRCFDSRLGVHFRPGPRLRVYIARRVASGFLDFACA